MLQPEFMSKVALDQLSTPACVQLWTAERFMFVQENSYAQAKHRLTGVCTKAQGDVCRLNCLGLRTLTWELGRQWRAGGLPLRLTFFTSCVKQLLFSIWRVRIGTHEMGYGSICCGLKILVMKVTLPRAARVPWGWRDWESPAGEPSLPPGSPSQKAHCRLLSEAIQGLRPMKPSPLWVEVSIPRSPMTMNVSKTNVWKGFSF